MLTLPRPYPDELVGSMLCRASRQTGLGMKLLIQRMTGSGNTSHPATITRHHGVAAAFGFALEEFLHEHTLYPYTTAFWQSEDRAAMTRKLLNPTVNMNVSFLSQNSGKAVDSLRFCPGCVSEDAKQYGESYWKRSHQLPGVSYCVKHEEPLRDASVGLNWMFTVSLPHQLSHRSKKKPLLERPKALKVAQISEAALNGQWHVENPTFEYRHRAVKLGYGLTSGTVYTEVFSRDFQAFYGSTFLESLGCELKQVNRPWVSNLVATNNTAYTALRHVLLLAFLESAPVPSKSPRDHLTRKKPRDIDWSALEKTAVETIRHSIAFHQSTGTRTTVKDLLTVAGMFGTYGHNRQRFATLTQLLVEFKASPQSERQTGRRPRAYRGGGFSKFQAFHP